MTKTMDPSSTNQDELVETTTVFRRHSKGPVMFNGCSPSGDVIIIDNISEKKSYDLTGWYIERQTDSHSPLRYTFPDQFLLPTLTTVELWCESVQSNSSFSSNSQSPDVEQNLLRMTVSLPSWNRADQWSHTYLFDKDGLCRAHFSHRTLPMNEKEYVSMNN